MMLVFRRDRLETRFVAIEGRKEAQNVGRTALYCRNIKGDLFQNPSNFYKVLLIKVSETNSDYLEQEIVVTGSFGDMQEDEDYRFFGHFVDHPRYGKQFLVESYEQAHPTSANGLINYL